MSDRKVVNEVKKQLRSNDNIINNNTIYELKKKMLRIQSISSKELLGNIFSSSTYTSLDQLIKKKKIGLISNFNINNMKNFLAFEGIKNDTVFEYYINHFGLYYTEMLNERSQLYQFNPDITVCLLDDEVIVKDINNLLNLSKLEEDIAEYLKDLENVIKVFISKNKGTLIINTIPLRKNFYNSLLAYNDKSKLRQIWNTLNTAILKMMDKYKQLVILDIEMLLQDKGVSLINNKLYYYASQTFSNELMSTISNEVIKISNSLTGKQKKCLVLDLDNTLWGGVIGDDGLSGIHLGPDNKYGNTFYQFQKYLKLLNKQGVLLSINSKNEWNNVKQVFDEHPFMHINQNDITKYCINWDGKERNMHTISKDINIGMNSLVFVDDNPVERDVVESFIKDISIIDMPEDSSDYSDKILETGYFNILSLTKEDYSRQNKYNQLVKREESKQHYTDIKEYLHSLKIEVKVLEVNDYNISRISQLTQRTNQFNMTTWRLTEAEINNLNNRSNYQVLGFNVTDKFGDSGIVGAVFLKKFKSEWTIENFIMSCRVFSKDIEKAILFYIIEKAKKYNITNLKAIYTPSSKNKIFADFYLNNNFKKYESNEKSIIYSLNIKEENNCKIPWIKIESEEN
ncbi:HAD-IIIC family phosphatase [Staphylococcus epidermidis]|uniref:HAD-IIIC family phosphatase n=3 Tax=Staphylococcus TaxID=1279 RepID=UPI0021A38009|nr:HAD-IIIC family phosphatase [Staphylococcus epidermidis]MCT1513180.1 HAD-IIIC family phosphatase [Staphylococcus epidermidis]